MPGQDIVWRLYRAGSALGAGRAAVHAGESGVERDAARRTAAQRQRVLRRVWRRADLRRDALAGELAAGARLQPADPARLLLLGARSAPARAPARCGAAQPLVGRDVHRLRAGQQTPVLAEHRRRSRSATSLSWASIIICPGARRQSATSTRSTSTIWTRTICCSAPRSTTAVSRSAGSTIAR